MRNLFKLSLVILVASVFTISCNNADEKKAAPVDTVKTTIDTTPGMQMIDTTKKLKTDSSPIIPPKS
jgi:hypothetical protein